MEDIEAPNAVPYKVNIMYRGTVSRPGHSLFFSRFPLRSPLILFPWIAIALSLILQIIRFAHRSIALKKTMVCSSSQAVNTT